MRCHLRQRVQGGRTLQSKRVTNGLWDALRVVQPRQIDPPDRFAIHRFQFLRGGQSKTRFAHASQPDQRHQPRRGKEARSVRGKRKTGVAFRLQQSHDPDGLFLTAYNGLTRCG